MGLFNLFKKKDDTEIINKMIAFSTQALDPAKEQIEAHGTFLPFGAMLTTDRTLQLIVYHDPRATSVDPRAHATIIQKLIAQKYKEPKCELVHMAFDGTLHLPTGDIDAIHIRISNKPTNTHKLISYSYKLENGKCVIQNLNSSEINKA